MSETVASGEDVRAKMQGHLGPYRSGSGRLHYGGFRRDDPKSDVGQRAAVTRPHRRSQGSHRHCRTANNIWIAALPIPRADRSAPVVTQLEHAGAVVIGKTNLNEFAYGVSGFNPHYGLMRTPHDRSRTPGGSSGGSAVAVAAGYCDIGLGTDTGGSVRIPAACCGIIGFKCAHSTVSMRGVHPLATSHDSIGYFVRSIDVLQRVLGISRLPDPRELSVCDDGLSLMPTFPRDEHWVTFRAESYPLHRDRARQFPDEFGHDLLVKLGGEIGDVAGAQAVVKQWRSAAEQSFLGFDLMVMPVFPARLRLSKRSCRIMPRRS